MLFVVAHHQDAMIPDLDKVFDKLVSSGVHVLALDDTLGQPEKHPEHFLPCRHWTSAGHANVAEAIVEFLSQVDDMQPAKREP